MDWISKSSKAEYDPSKIDRNVKILFNRIENDKISFTQELDLLEKKYEQTLQEDDAVSIFRQEARKFTFEADQINMNGVVNFGDNMSFIDGKMQIKRPDGAIWMQDGIVNQDYSINGFDPRYADLGRATNASGSWDFDPWNVYNKYYRTSEQGLGSLDGDLSTEYASYSDVRDSSKGYTINFQRYEVLHTSRYIVFGIRVANNSSHPERARFRIYEGSTMMVGADLARDSGYTALIVNLGVPTYKKRTLDLRVGWIKSWKKNNNDIIGFRVNRIFLTDQI